MWKKIGAGLIPAVLVVSSPPSARAAAESDTVAMWHEPTKYEIVVSATRTPRDLTEIPNAATVVSGAELRRRGTRTLAEALQDVAGLDTGEGSDNGLRLPNLGMWGLKEFDALLITVDGVPVGGPFNPSLAQISVEDVDRIEIVKGPQGTLYGVSAFAGMISVFTRGADSERASLTGGGGSFGEGHGSAELVRTLGAGTRVRLGGGLERSDGWQDRTGNAVDRGSVSLVHELRGGNLGVTFSGLRHTQRWGTPMPYESGAPAPGFLTDKNYAARGARIDHHIASVSTNLSLPLTLAHRLEGTVAYTRDDQYWLRSFPDAGAAAGDTVPSAGVELRPLESTAFADLHLVSKLSRWGDHQLVSGAAVTWGRTTADGRGFDFDQEVGDPASIPEAGAIPTGDLRSFEDRRTFLGFYSHDEWTPVKRFTLSGGGRYDRTSEKLHAQAQEQGPPLGPLELADDARDQGAWSGDISGLVRLAQPGESWLETANLYASYKSSFKPAAPNLTEAEGAEILDPERTHSLEVGLKSRALRRQVAFDVSWFDMIFDNIVVSVLDAGGGPALANGGRQRFKGVESSLSVAPEALHGSSVSLSYSFHDARFVHFTFTTPDSQLIDVSGKMLELVPRHIVQARVNVSAPHGTSLFGAIRYQGERPLTRRNSFFADAYTEWDLGAAYEVGHVRVSVTGRNLGDDRHLVSESDIGDSQFYLAPPRRVTAEASYRF